VWDQHPRRCLHQRWVDIHGLHECVAAPCRGVSILNFEIDKNVRDIGKSQSKWTHQRWKGPAHRHPLGRVRARSAGCASLLQNLSALPCTQTAHPSRHYVRRAAVVRGAHHWSLSPSWKPWSPHSATWPRQAHAHTRHSAACSMASAIPHPAMAGRPGMKKRRGTPLFHPQTRLHPAMPTPCRSAHRCRRWLPSLPRVRT
jgi:hypothetical protein